MPTPEPEAPPGATQAVLHFISLGKRSDPLVGCVDERKTDLRGRSARIARLVSGGTRAYRGARHLHADSHSS
jgi:hypothetical protein